MDTPSDSYLTITGNAEAVYKEKGSKFMAYAYHVESETEIKELIDALKKKFYDATHHCYAWRLGASGNNFRINDDGEPSGTAGKPIFGQLLSKNVTNILVVVVRYFGGTKLGVSGLISAYKESTAMVLSNAHIEERTVNAIIEIQFGYLVMNDVMKTIKEMQPDIILQHFDNTCNMTLSIRQTSESEFIGKLEKIEGINIEQKGYK